MPFDRKVRTDSIAGVPGFPWRQVFPGFPRLNLITEMTVAIEAAATA